MAVPVKLLIIRFSAMGDVAMTAPVLKELTAAYPNIELLLLSRSLFQPFFKDIPNLSFHPFEPKGRHKGFLGLLRLFMELKKQNITAVADLHHNLRSLILCVLFFLCGVRLRRVNKGRPEKKRLTRQIHKELIPLPLTTERYAMVFKQLGFPFTLQHQLLKPLPALLGTGLSELMKCAKNGKYIGISPFAQHLQKVYPLHQMELLVISLAEMGHQVFIFGGGPEEKAIATAWEKKSALITSLIGKVTLEEELDFISHLDVMVSMDSANMHLASLKGIPVVSIWGATHPYAGFMGYGQSIADAAQIELECRPCSIYGNKPCFRGDFACMNNLQVSSVLDKVIQKIDGKTTPPR